jgi:chorismate dehydratase
MTRRLRISAISYLNTAPLMWDFEHGTSESQFDIAYTIPSGCATALQTGAADIGIIPAAAYASIPGLVVLPDIAIAARRAVRSILLVSKVPLEQVGTVALDTSSLTSVALTKVIFAKWLGGGRTFAPMPPDLDLMLAEHDAALVIGDPALQVDRARYLTFDLAEQWIRFTGKPFVFAFWALREAALRDAGGLDVTAIFQQSRDNGLKPGNVDAIARWWGPRLGMTEDDVRSYLTENIDYYLDSETLDGLLLFFEYGRECGALSSAPPLKFHELPRPVSR